MRIYYIEPIHLIEKLLMDKFRIFAYLFFLLSGIATLNFYQTNTGPLATSSVPFANPPQNRIIERAKKCGVSWVAGRPVTEDDFLPLVRNHVNWIVQTPFGWQQNFNSPILKLVTEGGIYWGEKDIGIETTTRLARKFGIKTMLKPHIWMHQKRGGRWRGQIEMENEADWQRWFESYRAFILHYAELAEKNHIEALCIGTELHITAQKREGDWQKIIAEVRKVYHGQITYSANWYHEFEEVNFWDELDFIGIQAYFPLTDKESPTIEELRRGWRPHLATIENLQKRYNKTVLFTEIGYRSTTDAAIEPWRWPRFFSRFSVKSDLQTQANCYEAFFQSFWDKAWFDGAFFWKWFPRHNRAGGEGDIGFTPQNKPAEAVMAKWFGNMAN